jgi:hypothetical protein
MKQKHDSLTDEMDRLAEIVEDVELWIVCERKKTLGFVGPRKIPKLFS